MSISDIKMLYFQRLLLASKEHIEIVSAKQPIEHCLFDYCEKNKFKMKSKRDRSEKL